MPLRQRLSRFIGTVFPVGSAGLGFAMIRPCTAKKIKYIYENPPGVKAETVTTNTAKTERNAHTQNNSALRCTI